MKHLLTLILLLCALTTHAQNSRRATVQPDTSSYKVDLLNAPRSKWDTIELSANEAWKRRRLRHGGLVCAIVGGGVTAGGIAIAATANNLMALIGGGVLIGTGSTVALIGGVLMLSSITPHHERYSIVLHPTGLGLAYNF